MFTPSKKIDSPQHSPHKGLVDIVDKHNTTVFLKPISAYTQSAFERAYEYWIKSGRPNVILDSACGTGESSRYFSEICPDYLVIGVDQSLARLQNSANGDLAENCLLLRCDCTDFWRLSRQSQWFFKKHVLLYPNPWPKGKHLQRRWHGHPAFPDLVAVSESIELRSNWKMYALEFANALRQLGRDSVCQAFAAEHPITAFERKYKRSGHELWQVRAG
ncbi:MAG: SAM-dependent methyltransferase [Pseudomonadota bacterium]